MQNPCVCLFFWFFFLFAATFCHGSDLTTVEVVGVGECADCHKNNIKTSHAFSGLRVSIDCKKKDGDFERKGVAELDEDGKFKVLLPTEVLEDGKLKEKCFAQLHSASSTPCPSHDGLESSVIVFKSKGEGKQTFGLSGGLKFKSATCVSAFFWHYHHHPPLPPISFPVFPPHPPLFGHPYLLPPYHHKFFPPKVYPPPTPKEPVPPPVPEKPPPVYEKPPPVYEKPPPVPIYKKPLPPPVYKPKPPKPPVYKPKPPVYKPKPPVYKPKPPVYKPPTPVYKHPWYKILPPISKLPPCPPGPKVIPVVPPKYFSHPKFGKKFPPLPPPIPHP